MKAYVSEKNIHQNIDTSGENNEIIRQVKGFSFFGLYS